jgi:adenylate kinase family enzyme
VRLHVTGHSCTGKSTLAAQIAEKFDIPCVELDALNWLPGWVGLNVTDPERLAERIRATTAGESWVLAGSYESFVQPLCWPRLDALIFLDLPRWQLIPRVLGRSWRRWRSHELLWGTNYEKFWPQLAVWNREDSLVWWIWTQHARKRARFAALRNDERYRHIHLVHLQSVAEIDAFRQNLDAFAASLR